MQLPGAPARMQLSPSARPAQAASAAGVTQRLFATSQRVFDGQARPPPHMTVLGEMHPAAIHATATMTSQPPRGPYRSWIAARGRRSERDTGETLILPIMAISTVPGLGQAAPASRSREASHEQGVDLHVFKVGRDGAGAGGLEASGSSI